MQSLSLAQLDVFTELTERVTDDPLLYLQYANAAQTAQDYETAITAYERYLELQPNAANSEQVQELIDQLKAISGAAPGGNPQGGSDGGSDGE